MARLGFRTVNEMIGQTDKIIPFRMNDHWKARGIDLSKPLFKPTPLYDTNLYRTRDQDHGLEKQLDYELIKLAAPALEKGTPVQITTRIRNIHRCVGTMLSGEIAKRYGDEGLPAGTIKIKLRGTAGQSFGTFLAKGIEMDLTGESNDYTGKGLSGGILSVKIPPEVTFDPAENIIAGNTCLYGATSGEAYINGVVGERFAVRNSGAYAVVEGVGDHGCEYMTGGRVVILGKTGRNFAAGMSGGIAYIWDPSKEANKYINHEMVDVEYLIYDEDAAEVKLMIENHFRHTNSKRAEYILFNWDKERENFWKIIPGEYKKALAKLAKEEAVKNPVVDEKALEEVTHG
jgi:glutamate synthase domain-containing protein 3